MDPVQAITVLGAAGALVWVVILLTADKPRLHTHSEVEGLKTDKAALWSANRALQRAVDANNEGLKRLVDALAEGEMGTMLVFAQLLQDGGLDTLIQLMRERSDT